MHEALCHGRSGAAHRRCISRRTIADIATANLPLCSTPLGGGLLVTALRIKPGRVGCVEEEEWWGTYGWVAEVCEWRMRSDLS